jgi:hypothetical protein
MQEAEGLFSKKASKGVSSNLEHRSKNGWLRMIVCMCISRFVFLKENGHKNVSTSSCDIVKLASNWSRQQGMVHGMTA